jgi:O-antigen ligase
LSLTSLIVLPWFLIDAMTVPKFTLLVLTATIFLRRMIVLKKFKSFNKFLDKPLMIILCQFIIFATWSLLINGNISRQLFGENGRNNGFLTYIALLIVSAYIWIFAGIVSIKRLLFTFQITAFLVAVYFLTQFVGVDFAPWEEWYGIPSSFLGNPNFVSSFVGIALGCTIIDWMNSVILDRNKRPSLRKVFWKNTGVTFLAIALFGTTLILNRSTQGFVCLGLILLTNLIIRIYLWISRFQKEFRIKSGKALLSLIIIVGGFFTLTLINVLGFLDTAAVVTRIWFWKSAYLAILQSPINGIGFDQFGDYYRQNRTVESFESGNTVVVDSPHSFIIDLALNAGAMFALTYLALIVLLVSRFLRYLSKPGEKHSVVILAFSLFVAYQFQAQISPNQISLALWGAIFMAILLKATSPHEDSGKKEGDFGHGQQTAKAEIKGWSNKGNQNKSKIDVDSSRSLRISVFSNLIFALGLISAVAPLRSDFLFRESLYTSDLNKISAAAITKPTNSQRLLFAVETLCINGDEQGARELLKQAIEFNPRDFETWAFHLRLPNKSNSIERALGQMRLLDPNNSDLRTLEAKGIPRTYLDASRATWTGEDNRAVNTKACLPGL